MFENVPRYRAYHTNWHIVGEIVVAWLVRTVTGVFEGGKRRVVSSVASFFHGVELFLYLLGTILDSLHITDSGTSFRYFVSEFSGMRSHPATPSLNNVSSYISIRITILAIPTILDDLSFTLEATEVPQVSF